MKKSLMLALALAFAAAAPAYAEDSPWSVKFGLGWVNPKSDNGRLANAFDAEVSSELNLTPAIEYRLSDHWATELLLAVPFKHDVELNGIEAASFKHLPPTLSLKYLFSPDQAFSPYIGAGLNYTLVFDEETRGPIAGTKLSGDNSFGPALVAGFEYRNNSPWGLDSRNKRTTVQEGGLYGSRETLHAPECRGAGGAAAWIESGAESAVDWSGVGA